MIALSKFSPWGNKFLVRPLPRKDKTDAGIIIADTVSIEGEEAEIMAMGDGCTKGEIGQTVLYATGAGWGLEVNGVKMRVVPQESIEGVVG